jgi:hypothetical protein
MSGLTILAVVFVVYAFDPRTTTDQGGSTSLGTSTDRGTNTDSGGERG